MRRSWRAVVPALVLCAAGLQPALAQEAKTPAEAPAAEEPQKTEGEIAFEELSKQMTEAVNAWRKAYAERPQGEAAKGWKAPPRPEPEFVRKFAAGAERFAGTEDAVPFLLRVAGYGRSYEMELGKAAIDTLVTKHVDSSQLDQMTFTLIYGAYGYGEDVVVDAMTKVIDGTSHASVKGAMLFARGAVVNRRGASSDEERAAAVADLRAAIEAAPETRYGKMAAGYIYELENLQIGMVAPDIDGKDLDGVAFKLSDYRGKVVVLDFWGDW
jgi:hypothetical protein